MEPIFSTATCQSRSVISLMVAACVPVFSRCTTSAWGGVVTIKTSRYVNGRYNDIFPREIRYLPEIFDTTHTRPCRWNRSEHISNFSQIILRNYRSLSATNLEKTPEKDPYKNNQGNWKRSGSIAEEITCTKNENFITVAAVAYPMWK